MEGRHEGLEPLDRAYDLSSLSGEVGALGRGDRSMQQRRAGRCPGRILTSCMNAFQHPTPSAALLHPPNSARSSTPLLAYRHQADSFAGCQVSGVLAIARRFPGQAVADGLLVWRGRRVRGAPAAAVVDPGLRPRFFSVLPTPANFRSR